MKVHLIAMDKNKAITIALIGGGRWARVIGGVLSQSLPKNSKVLWVSHYNQDLLKSFAQKHNHIDFTVMNDDTGLDMMMLDAAIVVTSPATHVKHAVKFLKAGIPVFVEKPLTLTAEDTNMLLDTSTKMKAPLGVDLVFMYADYVHDFAQALKSTSIKNISLEWHDPAFEMRHGENKFPDLYTAMPHDMFPHAWSLLKVLIPNLNMKLDGVNYKSAGTFTLQARHEECAITISFSRMSQTRARTIRINDGEFSLDFTNEPGIITVQGQSHDNSWKGHTPLRQSLDNFFEVVADHKNAKNWRINAHSCAPSVYLAEELQTLLKNAQHAYLTQYKPSVEDYDLIIDIFMPLESLKGHRPSLYSVSDKKAFAAYVLSVYDLDEF